MSVDDHARLAELAAALKQRFRATNDPRDLDRCIELYAKLLDGPGDPGSVAVYVGYANALLNRFEIRGDRSDAAAALSAAHRAVDLAGDDGARAVALNVTANARTAAYQSGSSRSDLLAALEAQREAAALLSRGASRPPAAFLVNLASRLIYAYDLLRDTALLDEAVACSERALGGPLSDEERPAALNNLGLALRARFERSRDPEDLRRSLEAQRESLDRTSPRSVERPSRLNNLANAWWATYLASGVLQDLDQAVAAYQEAADAATNPMVRSACLLGLGTARWNRWGRRKTPADLDAAIGAFETARGLVPPDSPGAAHCALNLGAAYFARWRHKHASSDLDDAIAYWAFARQSRTAEGEVAEAATSNLGAALWERYEERSNDADLDQAIALLSATPTQARITLQPGRLFTLAGALRRRHQLRGATADLAAGAAAYRKACTIGAETNPGVALQSGQQWGEWAAGRGALDEAEEAYAIATGAAQRMYRSQAAEADTEVWLGEATTLAARRSYVQCQLGDPLAAALTLEHGRAYLLSEAMTRRERRAEQAGDVVTADADTVTHAGTPVPVVYLAATPWGGVAIRIDVGGATPIDLPDLTEEAVAALSRDFIAARDMRHRDRSAWHQQVARTCMALWDLGVDRLVTQLSDVEAAVIVPTGLLTLLPLHAATPAIEGGYALDTLRLTYAPNARLLLNGSHAANTGVHDSVLVVDAPHRADLSPLRFSPIEARAAIRARPRCEHLHGKEATIPRVRDALGRNDLLHFSCHATADPARAWASALLLADGPLTVERIRQAPPRHARLAFLSACETAVVSYALPDEVIAFPSVLLAAGIPGVIASLWPVPQAATALLVTAFYDELLRGIDLPDALRQAQRTVREATGSLISERLELPRQSAPAPGSRPFSHPVFWAGFTFTGT